MFVIQAQYSLAIRETSGPAFDHQETSEETVADLFSYCREVCVESLYSGEFVKQIGGPNHIVEVDEAKFGKRKYNRGRIVEGQWVLGGICRETREWFFVPVENRSEETLLPIIIIKHVAAGSIIYSDQWAAYGRLSEVGFQHGTVNHSLHFVDPASGVHTNTIESTWWAVKRSLPPTHTRKQYLGTHLAEYIWRRKYKNERCLFSLFLKEIVRVYPGLDA
ncbi:hypothetical protein ElyMa_004437700 [Elysia marginata]|uniref:ISXO2-like transposase domain-containing protein n=1 Tax=Elysia marginata TaxID=1093978 RepID=A0AAV4HCB0_9GAST|nr:hypothetical protein ElyMa_004437700 [Elysia marginata]